MKVSRAWLQTYFEEPLPSAEALVELLTFHAFEVEGVEQVGEDWVLDVDVLANRSSDCLSHRGIARELSTLLNRPLKYDPLRKPLPSFPETDTLRVSIADKKICPRYIGAVIRGVTVAPSPDWIVERLQALGQKSINNVVDITNLIMYDLGQPLHAFDFDKLAQDEQAARSIVVRQAEEGESFTSLTGDTYTLSPRNALIGDGVSGAPLALAGIKGGKEAEVTKETKDIVLEAGNFNYVSVRKTSRELKLATDASVRFQNEPSPLLPMFAVRDALELFESVAGGVLVGVIDVFEETPKQEPVLVSLAKTNSLLGTSLSAEEVEKILIRLEVIFSRSGDTFSVSSPWERSDLATEESVIEEIGRIFGYMNIVGVLPQKPAEKADINPRHALADKLRHILREAGYSELYTYTMCEVGDIALMNPMSRDKACLRVSLREGLEKALVQNGRNAPLLGLPLVKVFELGAIFPKEGEKLSLGLGVCLGTGGNAKQVQKELTATTTLLSETLGVPIVWDIQNGTALCTLDEVVEKLGEPKGNEPALPWNTEARYTAWSSFPFMLRDVAVWAPKEVLEEELLAVIIETAPDTLVRHDLFDRFEKEGRVSYAWHLVFQSKEKTLTDAEVGGVMDAVTEALKGKGWEVR